MIAPYPTCTRPALTRLGPEKTWGQDLWVLQDPILEDSSAEDTDNGFEIEVRLVWLRRTRLRGTIKSNLRRNQSLKRSQDAWKAFPDFYLKPGSERNLYFLAQNTRKKKPFPGSRPLWTHRLHADWPWQESTAWQTNTKSAWSWQLHNTESLAWSWRHRATPGTKLLIQDLPWKLHKLQCRARIQGFLATGLAPVAKPVNLIKERLRKARKATSWLSG